ncbi:1,4-alpha-glucan branching protein GlgB [Mobilicoccus sp.]|uniref:1,4-alpha-glucan branching protein GlgB n=1 Tax=Mobilicoccus sp. TaxID=2034349 RepID=UPI0028B0BBD6|nr:1,4-alpha-glucan branching protein GlgB [Mobilicoccus sp.]
MAKIYDAALFPTKLELLASWLPFQRWFRGTHEPQLRRLGGYRLDDPDGEVGVETLIVADDSGDRPVVYQVPVTYRAEPLVGAERALVGTMEHSVLGTRYVYDAPHDPVYASLLLGLLTGHEEAQHASRSHTPHPSVAGRPLDGADTRAVTASRVLAGEQSNTSIILETTAGDGAELPVICKVFRVLQHGENPDVELQTALAKAGSTDVPAPLGSIHGTWRDPEVEGARAEGPLAFASEFLPGTRDAWRVALEAARRGEDFSDRARALGSATAAIHVALAEVLPTRAADEGDRRALGRSFHDRAAAALTGAPDLADLAATIERVEGGGLRAPWPDLQRVHGDYHLGQVLDVPDRGWVVLDFEGEPLRPMDERTAPDLALRDVAGMLRSFDYVAGTLAQEASEATDDTDTTEENAGGTSTTPSRSAEDEARLEETPRVSAQAARAWAEAAREAFLDGYAATGPDPRDASAAPLLRALELDKALYEVTYEARNRPTWVDIPARAVRTLCDTGAEPVGGPSSEGDDLDDDNDPTDTTTTARRSVTQVSDPTTPAPGTTPDHTTGASDATGTGELDPTATPLSSEEDDAQVIPASPEEAPGATGTGWPMGTPVPADAAEPSSPSPSKASPAASSARPSGAATQTGPASPSATGLEPEPEAEPQAIIPEARHVHLPQLDLLVRGGHGDPHQILGAHPHDGGTTIRALRPLAKSVVVELSGDRRVEMTHEHQGIWLAHVDGRVDDYRLLVTYADGPELRQDDPYRFWPTLGDIDLHLIGEGRHEELWKVLGSHLRTYPGGDLGEVHGTSFAVWAPNARAVRVVGDFNSWNGQTHPMRALGSTGVWELFVPGVGENSTYKYEILGRDGYWRTKADPLARATECPPATASVVTESHYSWNDGVWLNDRARHPDPHNRPMSTYEVHLGSWRPGLTYVELADQLVDYVKDLGFTHVELLPVAEHPYGPSWGYQVTGYYAPTSRFGSPDEFRHLVDRLHQAGIGVILDWVPAHFPKDGFALGRFDGEPLYEHPDPRRGEHKDWGTYIFDFGRPQVRNFLVANACYWIEEFHIDGLRVDAVASMLYLDYSREDGEWAPNQFGGRENLEAVQLLQETNATVYRRYPGAVTVAEESTSWAGVTKPTYMGGLGFGLKWNMGWMHDSLGYVELAPIYRQYHHHQITFSMVYAYSENFVLPISHDEVVHGKGSMLRKMPGDRWEQLANLRAYYAFMWSHPGKQLLFMGCEFAQESEWADSRSLDWWLLDHAPHQGVHALIRDLNGLYTSRPALWQLDNDWEGFSWIDANDASGNTYSFLRFGKADERGDRPVVASIVNYSGMEHHQYRIGLPRPGVWRELLNTDAEQYGGAGVGNLGEIIAEEVPWHGQPYSAVVTMQKLSAVWFEPVADGSGESSQAQTPGVPRPELSRTPVAEEEVVRGNLSEAELRADPAHDRHTSGEGHS